MPSNAADASGWLISSDIIAGSLGLVCGSALIAVLIWFRRGDVAAFTIIFSWLALGPVSGIAMARRFSSPAAQGLAALVAGFGSITGAVLLILAFAGAGVPPLPLRSSA